MNLINIQQLIDINYTTDTRVGRRTKNVRTQEFFTPFKIIEKMCNEIPESDWKDPNKTWLEPSAGNGNLLLYIIWNRIQHGIDWKTTLETLYGVELMNDNVHECKERILDLLDKLQIEYNKEEAKKIMDKNLVCHDFFEWNFEEWRPYTEEELKQNKKK